MSQALHRDLHPFGCYAIGHLPREFPEVADTTHSDRGLEGAFLGWDIAMPTVWIWSFRKKEPVRMHDPVFYGQKFPFLDPTVLLNRDIAPQDIERMRAGDSEMGFETESGDVRPEQETSEGTGEAQRDSHGSEHTTAESELSQASTQPAAAQPSELKGSLPGD
eukprot:2527675-Rhodomonas_salina.1